MAGDPYSRLQAMADRAAKAVLAFGLRKDGGLGLQATADIRTVALCLRQIGKEQAAREVERDFAAFTGAAQDCASCGEAFDNTQDEDDCAALQKSEKDLTRAQSALAARLRSLEMFPPGQPPARVEESYVGEEPELQALMRNAFTLACKMDLGDDLTPALKELAETLAADAARLSADMRNAGEDRDGRVMPEILVDCHNLTLLENLLTSVAEGRNVHGDELRQAVSELDSDGDAGENVDAASARPLLAVDWQFVDMPEGKVRAHNQALCEEYARMDMGDLLLLSHQWRLLAQRFVQAAERAGHHHGSRGGIVHDEQVQRVTKILETAIADRGMEGVDRLGRCLRHPSGCHLHWALASLDELDAKVRAEGAAAQPPTPAGAQAGRPDGSTIEIANRLLRLIRGFTAPDTLLDEATEAEQAYAENATVAYMIDRYGEQDDALGNWPRDWADCPEALELYKRKITEYRALDAAHQLAAAKEPPAVEADAKAPKPPPAKSKGKEWSKPLSKSKMMTALGIDSAKTFNTFADHAGIRQVGNRQTFQLCLDNLTQEQRDKLDKA